VDGTAKTDVETGGRSLYGFYDLLGADGARSVIREYLAQDVGLQCEQRYISDAYGVGFESM